MNPFNVFNLPDLRGAHAERLRAHVAELAEGLSVDWRVADVTVQECEADFGEGWFVSPEIRHEFDYLVALHELGHHALDLSTYEDDGETVIFENEIEVWRWVRERALVEVSEPAWQWCHVCLLSHSGQNAPPACAVEMRELDPEPGAMMRWR